MRLTMKAWFLAVGSLMILATSAFAEDYPTHSIKLVVGYAAGGAPDTVARILGQRMSQILKQSIIVENRGGAGGTLGLTETARAPADGYTLSLADIGELGIAPYIYKSLPYDTMKDFTPIGLAVLAPMVLMSNAKTTTIKTMQDLISQAKAHPGTLNYGSAGVGTIHHIAMEVFKHDLGLNIVHVPYKGSGQSVPALLSGEVQLVLTGFTQGLNYAKSGRVYLLGSTTLKRFPAAPDVPAMSEFDPGFAYSAEIGLLGPAGLSPEIVAKLSAALKTTLEDPGVIEKLTRVGCPTAWLSPKDYTVSLAQNLKKMKYAVELAHITPR